MTNTVRKATERSRKMTRIKSVTLFFLLRSFFDAFPDFLSSARNRNSRFDHTGLIDTNPDGIEPIEKEAISKMASFSFLMIRESLDSLSYGTGSYWKLIARYFTASCLFPMA
jgi:hypothetical protein